MKDINGKEIDRGQTIRVKGEFEGVACKPNGNAKHPHETTMTTFTGKETGIIVSHTLDGEKCGFMYEGFSYDAWGYETGKEIEIITPKP